MEKKLITPDISYTDSLGDTIRGGDLVDTLFSRIDGQIEACRGDVRFTDTEGIDYDVSAIARVAFLTNATLTEMVAADTQLSDQTDEGALAAQQLALKELVAKPYIHEY